MREKLCNELFELGFICVTGVRDVHAATPNCGIVRKGKPFTCGEAGGWASVCDGDGDVWANRRNLGGLEGISVHLEGGAHVPFANDGGQVSVELIAQIQNSTSGLSGVDIGAIEKAVIIDTAKRWIR